MRKSLKTNKKRGQRKKGEEKREIEKLGQNMSLAGLQNKEHTNKKHQWRLFRMGNVAQLLSSPALLLLVGSSGCAACLQEAVWQGTATLRCRRWKIQAALGRSFLVLHSSLFFSSVFFQPEQELAV